MKRIYSTLVVLICVAAGFNSYGQSAVNHHLSMSLQNCSQNSNTIQFDLFVVNDGASDLRANAFQCGINYNKGIVKSGATLTTSFVKSSSDFAYLNGFNFPTSKEDAHIRIVQSAYTKGNTGKSMMAGHPYRIGTFRITSSLAFVDDQTPDFVLQNVAAPGKTVCAAVVWLGTAPTTTSITIPAKDNDTVKRLSNGAITNVPSLAATIECRTSKNKTGAETMTVYPNPASDKTTVSFNSTTAGSYQLTVLDIASREVMVKDGKAVEGVNNIQLDLSHLAKGAYLVNLKSKDNTHSVRVTVE